MRAAIAAALDPAGLRTLGDVARHSLRDVSEQPPRWDRVVDMLQRIAAGVPQLRVSAELQRGGAAGGLGGGGAGRGGRETLRCRCGAAARDIAQPLELPLGARDGRGRPGYKSLLPDHRLRE